MNPILKNILVTVGGLIIGNAVNFATIVLGTRLIPPPEGVDPMNPQSLADNIDKFENYHFLMPLLAHALGTFIAAFFICRFVDIREKTFALGVGFLFLLGGIANAFMIPAPSWFISLDLIVAYIPMALLGYFLAMKSKAKQNALT